MMCLANGKSRPRTGITTRLLPMLTVEQTMFSASDGGLSGSVDPRALISLCEIVRAFVVCVRKFES